MKRLSYHVQIVFNRRMINEVIVDQHYSNKHPEINDGIILELVKKLNYQYRLPEKRDGKFSYYVEDPIFYDLKPYRLVYLIQENCHYIGVINAFRVKEKKK